MRIKNIKVCSSMKYFGVTITGKYNCFKVIKKGQERLEAQLYLHTHAVILKSCNKLLIGKSYWEGLY